MSRCSLQKLLYDTWFGRRWRRYGAITPKRDTKRCCLFCWCYAVRNEQQRIKFRRWRLCWWGKLNEWWIFQGWFWYLVQDTMNTHSDIKLYHFHAAAILLPPVYPASPLLLVCHWCAWPVIMIATTFIFALKNSWMWLCPWFSLFCVSWSPYRKLCIIGPILVGCGPIHYNRPIPWIQAIISSWFITQFD